MRLHRVIYAILMLRSFDWLAIASMSTSEGNEAFYDMVVIVPVWAGAWALVWKATEAFLDRRVRSTGTASAIIGQGPLATNPRPASADE